MSYNDKKFLDVNGLKHLISILDDYPTNEVLGTVINAIESEIPTNVSQLQNDAGYLTAHQDISGKANSADLAAVATSGDYDDLINKPTIPAVPVQDVQVNGTSVVMNGVANVPVATSQTPGVIVQGAGLVMQNNKLWVNKASANHIKKGLEEYNPIVPQRQHVSVYYALAKLAGADMASVTGETVGVYPDAQKAAIQNMLGITDLISTEESSTATTAHALNSTFMMNGKLHRATAAIAIGDAVEVGTNCEVVKADEVFVKNTDYADTGKSGVVSLYSAYGIYKSGGYPTTLQIFKASSGQVKAGTNQYCPIVPENQNYAVFYGLAKVAGADEKDSTLPVGQYTATAKAAIRSMIGAENGDDIVKVQDTEPTTAATKIWLPETAPASVTVPTVAEMEQALAEKVGDVQVNGTSVVENGIANIPIGSTNNYGLMRSANGITSTNGVLRTYYAREAEIKTGTESYNVIVPATVHTAAFYGLAKAAGDSTQSASDNAVGTYTDEAKSAIRTMLGVVGTTDYATEQTAGIVKVNGNYGIVQNGGAGGPLQINYATAAQCKNRTGSTAYQPLTVFTENAAAFYGLAYAAGDTTMSSSTGGIGVYTDNAKASIKAMLGIQDGSTGTVDVSGTTPTITAVENTRYVCGEVTSLNFTPPASGISIVRFTSGSTVTVLTIPSTVKFPEWFDPTSLETNTIYEICVTDGVYGAVMSWAL